MSGDNITNYSYEPNNITDWTALWVTNEGLVLPGAKALVRKDPTGQRLIEWLDSLLYGPAKARVTNAQARNNLTVYADSKARDALQDIDGPVLAAKVRKATISSAHTVRAKELGVWPEGI